MYISKGILLTKFPMNSDYMIWLITAFVLTTLILIVLVIVILICSSYRRKQKTFLNETIESKSRDIFIIEKSESNDNKKTSHVSINKVDNKKQSSPKSSDRDKRNRCICCLTSRTDSLIDLDEEGFVLIDREGQIMNIEIRDKDLEDENMLLMTASMSDGKNEYENGRLSHIDRELPPLPLLNNILKSNSDDTESLVKDSLITSLTGSLKYSDIDKPTSKSSNCSNTSCDESTLSRLQSVSIHQSPVIINQFGSKVIPCTTCCCTNNIEIPSSDDLSSTDYDPTYAAIRRSKVSCPICGAPSVYTPVNSNRNSNLSLQLNSCLGSPSKCLSNLNQNYEANNNSTYASIAKATKNISEKTTKREQEVKSGCSTIKRQRSISQGDIINGSLVKNNKMQQSEIVCTSEESPSITINKPGPNYMSLWSLMASNRNSPYNMFPIIPERVYGQSVVDLVEKLRASEDYEISDFVNSTYEPHFKKSYTQPLLFESLFKRRGSLTNVKGKIWTPQSCQMIHRSSFSRSALCSPLKIFDEDSNLSSYDYEFPDALGQTSFNPIHNYLTSSTKRSCIPFQPVLTPPISPMDCGENDKEITYNISKIEESKYENHSFFDSENSDDTIIKKQGSVYEDLDEQPDKEVIQCLESDHYEYLQDSLQLPHPILTYNGIVPDKLLTYESNTELLIMRPRPISIVLYGDDILRKDKSFNYRFDNLEVYGASSVQMSPLMEQSLENSSSKTTLSSLSYHQQFNRLMSSEDSCAKSPPSAETSPSLDKLEIASPDDNNFLYNEFLWSNFNSAFDDYETFE